jgi:hypothetical protein
MLPSWTINVLRNTVQSTEEEEEKMWCLKTWIQFDSFAKTFLNPFTAEVAIMRLLGSAPLSHLCDQKRRSKVTGLSDLMALFIDLGCLYCKQTQRAFNFFKNTLNWLKTDSVDQKFNWLEGGNFSQDSGMPGTEGVFAFSQLAVKGLISSDTHLHIVHILFYFFCDVGTCIILDWEKSICVRVFV